MVAVLVKGHKHVYKVEKWLESGYEHIRPLRVKLLVPLTLTFYFGHSQRESRERLKRECKSLFLFFLNPTDPSRICGKRVDLWDVKLE